MPHRQTNQPFNFVLRILISLLHLTYLVTCKLFIHHALGSCMVTAKSDGFYKYM